MTSALWYEYHCMRDAVTFSTAAQCRTYDFIINEYIVYTYRRKTWGHENYMKRIRDGDLIYSFSEARLYVTTIGRYGALGGREPSHTWTHAVEQWELLQGCPLWENCIGTKQRGKKLTQRSWKGSRGGNKHQPLLYWVVKPLYHNAYHTLNIAVGQKFVWHLFFPTKSVSDCSGNGLSPKGTKDWACWVLFSPGICHHGRAARAPYTSDSWPTNVGSANFHLMCMTTLVSCPFNFLVLVL